jgi:hypothetical protein
VNQMFHVTHVTPGSDNPMRGLEKRIMVPLPNDVARHKMMERQGWIPLFRRVILQSTHLLMSVNTPVDVTRYVPCNQSDTQE